MREGICLHMEQSVSAMLPGVCPKRGIPSSPSPSSQEAEGLPQTDLLVSVLQPTRGRYPQLSPLLPALAPGP